MKWGNGINQRPFVTSESLQTFKSLVNITKIQQYFNVKQTFVILNHKYQLVDLIETL